MRDLIVFNGASNLDFQEIRTNVIRIPQVVHRLREAQDIWDSVSSVSLDLTNFVASEDPVFLGHIRMKNFATAIVQIGLLDRYLKAHPLAQFVVGATNGDSPLKVALGLKKFRDLIVESAALTGSPAKTALTPLLGGGLPVLSGMQLAEFGAYQLSVGGRYERVELGSQEIEPMILRLVDEFEVRKVVMVGPGNTLFNQKKLELGGRDVQVLESIDLDPMLSWFWSRVAVAN